MLGFLLVGLRSFNHNGVEGRLQQLGIVEGRLQQLGIVDVDSRIHNAERVALSIHKETPLDTSLATVRPVEPNQVPPKRVLPMAPSAACHSQFTLPSSSHPSTRTAHIRLRTPSCTHRCRVR